MQAKKEVREYQCLDPECDWRERCYERKFIPEWLVLKFEFEGRLIYKCPYCRGKIKEVKSNE